MRITSPICLILWLAGTAAAQPAVEPEPAAAPPPRVVALVLPGPEATAAERAVLQRSLLAEAFQRSGDELDWLLVGYSPVHGGMKEDELLQQLEQRVEEGTQAYRYLKLEEAQAAFEQAVAMVHADPPVRCQPERMVELYLYWARAVLDGGDDTAAQALLGQIPRFDPKAAPDPAVMPPNLVASYDIALDNRRGRPEARVLLDIGPGGGNLYIDCRRQAAGVVDVGGRAGDEFLVVAEVAGGRFGTRLTFSEGPRHRLSIYSGHPGDEAREAEQLLALAKEPAALSVLGAAPRRELDALAGLLGAELFLLAEVYPGPDGKLMRLGLYLPGHGLQGKPADLPLTRSGKPDSDTLAGALEGLARTLRSPSLLTLLHPPKAPPKGAGVAGGDLRDDGEDGAVTPWYQTWWFWTAVGAVAVAGGVTAGVLVGTSGGSEPSGQVVLTVMPPR